MTQFGNEPLDLLGRPAQGIEAREAVRAEYIERTDREVAAARPLPFLARLQDFEQDVCADQVHDALWRARRDRKRPTKAELVDGER